MTDDKDKYRDYLAGSDFDDDMDLSIDELEVRLEQLEDQVSELGNQLQTSQTAGIGFYGLGTAIAVVLSWSRNASILWCIFHGIISWIYVAYFAFTRKIRGIK